MREALVARLLVDAVLGVAQPGARVARVQAWAAVGEPLDHGAVGAAFREGAIGTVAADAEIEIVQRGELVACPRCGARYRIPDARRCPACGGSGGLPLTQPLVGITALELGAPVS